MKTLALILSLTSFSALAATAKLTLTIDNYNIAKFKTAKVTFESTSPLCKFMQMTGAGPVIVNRTKSYDLSVDKVGSNSISIDSPTTDPKNDGCNYKFLSMSVQTTELYWVSLSSTRARDFDPSDIALDVLKSPNKRLEAECRGTQCALKADGSQIGYSSNAMVIYADKDMIERNNNVNARLRIRFN